VIWPSRADRGLVVGRASDAVVYVFSRANILVRRTEAVHTVAGFECRNTYRPSSSTTVPRNAAGFLVSNLPGLVHFGEQCNDQIGPSTTTSRSFAAAGAFPPTCRRNGHCSCFAPDQLESYDNEITDTPIGFVIVNIYGLADRGALDSLRLYPERDSSLSKRVPRQNWLRSAIAGPLASDSCR